MLASEGIQKVSSYAIKHFRCLLCGAPPVWGAAFVPDKSHEKRYGAKPGKGRAIGYALCEKCKGLPDRNERVEAILLFQARRKNEGMNHRAYSKDQQEELFKQLKKKQPCIFCNTLTSGCIQGEPEDPENFGGLNLLIVSVCPTCEEDPGVYDRLEERLRNEFKTREQKPGKVLLFGKGSLPARKKRWKSK